MDPQAIERLEARLRRAAQNFEYPPAPRLNRRPRLAAAALSGRRGASSRLAWGAALALLALLAGMLAAPGVRAAVAEFLQIGVVRIFTRPPERPAPQAGQPVTPAPPGLAGLERVLGETTLAEARRRVGFEIPLPAYPPDLGAPQRVFVQDLGGSMVILVWTAADDPERTRLSLHILPPGSFALTKAAPKVLQETQVGGLPAVWAEGPYLLKMAGGAMDIARLIDGHVLIWEQDELTYRLETDLPLEEAVRIAESLR